MLELSFDCRQHTQCNLLSSELDLCRLGGHSAGMLEIFSDGEDASLRGTQRHENGPEVRECSAGSSMWLLWLFRSVICACTRTHVRRKQDRHLAVRKIVRSMICYRIPLMATNCIVSTRRWVIIRRSVNLGTVQRTIYTQVLRASLLPTFDQVERLRKENASLRWRLAMAGTKSNNNLQGKASDEAGVMLKIKESKIRILEEQVKGASGTRYKVIALDAMEERRHHKLRIVPGVHQL